MPADTHLQLAPGYALIGEQVTGGTLFRPEAAAAVLATSALLTRPTRLSWLPAALVAAGALMALVGSVYEAIWYAVKVVAVPSGRAPGPPPPEAWSSSGSRPPRTTPARPAAGVQPAPQQPAAPCCSPALPTCW